MLSPTTGLLRGRVHLLPVRVYFEDTDAAGIVYYANYLKFAERGRTEMLRTLGVEQQRLREETGMQFVMREGEVKYRRPARLDDALTVETAVIELGAASVRMRQIIRRNLTQHESATGAEEEVARFTAHVACTGRDGKPMRLPSQLRDALEGYVSEA
ncbi:MAG: YbgC/FadM family acyl-CoA thioesterase [Rhodospirillaceae bacterium]|nr:YbgC/FadM family acyl-CoA thioesterase [Rhodospirillaceae bacterium]